MSGHQPGSTDSSVSFFLGKQALVPGGAPFIPDSHTNITPAATTAPATGKPRAVPIDNTHKSASVINDAVSASGKAINTMNTSVSFSRTSRDSSIFTKDEDSDNDLAYIVKKSHSDKHHDVEEHGNHKGKAGHDNNALQAAKLREGLFLMLSGLYGLIIVILGAVLPITEIFMGDVLDRSFQAFYIYLYVVSIVFLVYVYAYLLRRNQLKTEFLTRTLSRSLSWTRAWSKTMAKGAESDVKGKRKRMISLDSNHHTGTFYLRLGVLGFGIGSMIHSGLNFGAYVSVSSSCTEPIKAIKPVIHLIFTFFQLYFIFMNSKMCIHRYKKLARFGIMHMCATNICVWFHSIVVETMHAIHLQAHGSDHHDPGNHKESTEHPFTRSHR
uniref:Otopetrin n=1 Tax=Arion vulgaris TaxID=1028688 RepID=A0A0B7AYQ6_9EUPU